MADSPNPAGQATGAASTIVVQLPAPRPWSTWTTRILLALLGLSVLANISMYSSFQEYFQAQTPPA
ncbi:MAG TPA: signal peptide peptidase SppA, partial [Planctomycetaceae bacterium]|nr:signal peptide peptidase SppA [Planctomycetaceae bacterium]